MKISNKWELQQVVFNHSSHIEFRALMKLYKESSAKPYSFLVIDATLALNNPLHFRKESIK